MLPIPKNHKQLDEATIDQVENIFITIEIGGKVFFLMANLLDYRFFCVSLKEIP